MLKEYPQALTPLRECASRVPGRQPGAVGEPAAEILRIDPKYMIEGTAARLSLFKRTEDAEHYFDGLRKAGLPE